MGRKLGDAAKNFVKIEFAGWAGPELKFISGFILGLETPGARQRWSEATIL